MAPAGTTHNRNAPFSISLPLKVRRCGGQQDAPDFRLFSTISPTNFDMLAFNYG